MARRSVSGSASPTIEDLLGHTAGMNVHGIGLYPRASNKSYRDGGVPTLTQLVFGKGPATNDRVTFLRAPRTFWDYSGGGYSLAELLVENEYKTSFASFMATNVLGPAGMTRSTFGNPPASMAAGHSATLAPQKAKVCPGKAAGGLITTPEDFATFICTLIRNGVAPNGKRVIQPSNVTKLRTARTAPSGSLYRDWDSTRNPKSTRRYGFGVNISGSRISHGGTQSGYRSYFEANMNSKSGFVIFTNGESNQGTNRGSDDLVNELRSALRRKYGT